MPLVAKRQTREYSQVLSAIDPHRWKFSSLISAYVNTAVMNIFLDQVSKENRNEELIMFMDRAVRQNWRRHRSKDLKVPENIHIEYLPPYSPQLNPPEQLWKYLRMNHTGNRIFNNLDELEDTVIEALRTLMRKPSIVKSFSNFPWIKNVQLSN